METFVVNETKETFKLVMCTRCKKEKLQNEFKLYKGNYTKQCINCLEIGSKSKKKTKCLHNKEKWICKQCDGKGICEHDRQRRTCRDCKGTSICEHNKRRNRCVNCRGSGICEHDRQRTSCRDCKGGSICEHNRVRSYCKDCKGGSICEHDRQRASCRDCKGGSICEHNRVRSYCRDCKGGSICEHNREKRYCKICDFNGYLKALISNRVRECLKKNKELKSQEYIGCSTEELKEHLEKQFRDDMTWENYGKWHIDHKIPIKYKENGVEPTLEQVIERLHYTNLQPLWAEENISKGNKYIG
jgi:hypothetical protein